MPVLDSLERLRAGLERVGVQLWLIGVPGPARADLERDELMVRLDPTGLCATRSRRSRT